MAGIRIIKSYVWERAFLNKVANKRDAELTWVRRAAMSRAFLNLNITLAPLTMAVVSFSVFAALGGKLTAEIAFTSIALFNVIKLPLFFFPAVIQVVMEALISYRRVQEFLQLPETASPIGTDTEKGQAIQFQNAFFSWGDGAQNLTNLTFSADQGALVCVVGETGSGKSSLLNALLGEMELVRGTANVKGRLAYVSQQPWIFKGTIRDNILFGQPYNSQRYAETLSVCQLMSDVEGFPAGDLQEIGEQGVGLSGGQRQRLSLARAVYADADIFLFDDSLSALDSRVGRALFNECLMGLLQKKTRVLVCNQLYFVPQADQVIVFKNGRIAEEGTPGMLMQKDGEFAWMMVKYGLEDWQSDGPQQESNNPDQSTSKVVRSSPTSPTCPQIVGVPPATDHHATDSTGAEVLSDEYGWGQLPAPPQSPSTQTTSENEDRSSPDNETSRPSRTPTSPAASSASRASSGRFITDESRASGTTLTYKNIMGYVQALGGTAVLLQAALVYALLETCRLGNVYWLSWWSQGRWDLTTTQWLGVYASWGVGQSLCSLLNLWFLADRGVAAARSTHDTMLDRIVHAPVVFFDSTPIGRIMNRFSKDQRTVDTVILPTLGLTLSTVANLASTILLIGVNTPQTLFMMIPISLTFFVTQSQYRRAAREIRRMESTSRSPIFGHYTESLSGIATIRAFGAERHMEDGNIHYMQEHQRFQWAALSLNRWLSMRLEFLGGLIVFFTGCFAVMHRHTLGAPLLGLTLSQTFNVTALLSFLNRLFADLDTAFTSVERILEYKEVPQERRLGSFDPSPDWPQQGYITFQDVEIRYRPDIAPSLNKVAFQIRSGEKVGIVGRTGAGKSTLLVALYRLSELSAGHIYIDGVDISTVDLDRLRSAISIIPQTPIIFTGSIRENLDPFGYHTDIELWAALGHANLREIVEDLPGQLAFQVAEGGETFSVGQRQLLCLARALLRSTKILMIDEATASIDAATDTIVQDTIRKQFRSCTTITIAHRLNTIIDSDRVIVLNYGWIVQYDTPAKLLSIPHPQPSIFRDLVDETGDASANYLRSVAFTRPTLGAPQATLQLAAPEDVMPSPVPASSAWSSPRPVRNAPGIISADVADDEPMAMTPEMEGVLEYWFGDNDGSKRWVTPQGLSAAQRTTFASSAEKLLNSAMYGEAVWSGPRGALSVVILADQLGPKLGLPVNLVQGLQNKAVDVAEEAIESGAVQSLQPLERAFIYLALQRSEDPEDRWRCLDLLEELEMEVEQMGDEGKNVVDTIAILAEAVRKPAGIVG